MARLRFSGCGLKSERLEDRITPVAGYLRVVTYNVTASAGNGQPAAAGLSDIAKAINWESPNGVAEPVDLIALQEVKSQATTSAYVAAQLSAASPGITYAYGSLDGGTTGSGTQGVVYNSSKLTLLSEAAIGTSSTSGQPRQTMRYKFGMVGYPSSSDFYIYVSHAKASDDTTSESRRLVEAKAIRTDADTLVGANVIYAGDWNLYRDTDNSFEWMTGVASGSSGDGVAQDPLNMVGSWHANSAYKAVFTQAPAFSPPSGMTGGGVDDRFDWQMITSELKDGFGLDYVAGTYHTLAINGSLAVSGSVTDASNTALPGYSDRLNVFTKLTEVADHLPVVADYKFELPPTVTGITINDGSAQRSRVTSVTVNFSRAVTYPLGINTAFQLVRQGDNATVGISASTISTTSAKLQFTAGTAVDFGSLADGRYNLTIVATGVSSTAGILDGNSDMIPGGNYAFNSAGGPAAPDKIYRFFGDVTGTNVVGLNEFGVFRTTFNLAITLAFDFDNSGIVDLNDFSQFRSRFNLSLG